jgi:hypothetical protein
MGVNPTSTSTISFGGTPIGGLANITFALNRTPIDITELGNTFKKYLPGQSDGTATVEVFYDQAAHTAIEAALNAATASSAVVYTAHTGATFAFNAIVQRHVVLVACQRRRQGDHHAAGDLGGDHCLTSPASSTASPSA